MIISWLLPAIDQYHIATCFSILFSFPFFTTFKQGNRATWNTIYNLKPTIPGYLEQGMMVKCSRKLRQNYIASRKWVYDLLSLLPTDLVYFVWPSRVCPSIVPCPVIVRLNRLFRLPRMLEFFDRTETRTGYPNSFRICKVIWATLSVQGRSLAYSHHIEYIF